MAKYHYFRKDDDSEPECTSLSNAKKLLKQFPEGCAWTEHVVRGTFEGSTAIVLNGKNDATIPQHSDNKIFARLIEVSMQNEAVIKDREVKITIPASVIESLLLIKNNDDYEQNQIISDWLYSQVDTTTEILEQLIQ